MANEITFSATLSYAKGELAEDLAVSLAKKTQSGTGYTKLSQSISHSGEQAINLGGRSSLGYALFVNRDSTNYVDLKVATSGAIFARLDPDTAGDGTGGVALLKLGSGAQVPYALANTADCVIDVFLIEA